jgi:hypothetical protein
MEVLRNPRILNNLDDATATVVIQLALEELGGLLQEERNWGRRSVGASSDSVRVLELTRE